MNYYENFEDKKTTETISVGGGSIFLGIVVYIYIIWWILFAIVWFFSGITAFIASIACMFYDSSIGDKAAGFFLALFLGPFYWFFYIYKSSYCNRNIPVYAPINYN